MTPIPNTINWTVDDAFADIAAWLRAGDWEACAKLIKSNVRRSVYRFSYDTRVYYLKHDHPRGARNSIRSIWQCRAHLEFAAGAALATAGVPAITCPAWGRAGRDSLLLTVGIDAADVEPMWREIRSQENERRKYLNGMAAFIASLHKAGVVHHDLHPGNVIVKQCQGDYHFYLVDLYGVHVHQTLRQRDRYSHVHWARNIMRELDCAAEVLPILRAASLCDAIDTASDVWREILHCDIQRADARWRGRRLRFLRDSSLCECHREQDSKWLVQRPFAYDDARAIVNKHVSQITSNTNILKYDRKHCLTRVHLKNQSYIVKEYRRKSIQAQRTAGCRSWLNTHRLVSFCIPRPNAIAWCHANHCSFIIMEDIGDRILKSELAKSGYQQRRYWLAALSQIVAELHTLRIFHRDLKITNVLIRESTAALKPELVVVDLDDIRFQTRINHRRRQKNLAQIMESLPQSVTLWDRHRFLASYRQHCGLPKKEFRLIANELKRNGLLQHGTPPSNDR